MKNKTGVTIRYMGDDDNRVFLIERGDGKFWNGKDWGKNVDRAKLFCDHKTAQKTCTALQFQKYRGKPVRHFAVQIRVTLAADKVETISIEALARYLAEAVRIDIENAIHGDGPRDGSFVVAKMLLNTLEEAGMIGKQLRITRRPH